MAWTKKGLLFTADLDSPFQDLSFTPSVTGKQRNTGEHFVCFMGGVLHSMSNPRVKPTWHQVAYALMINYKSNRKDKQPLPLRNSTHTFP